MLLVGLCKKKRGASETRLRRLKVVQTAFVHLSEADFKMYIKFKLFCVNYG